MENIPETIVETAAPVVAKVAKTFNWKHLLGAGLVGALIGWIAKTFIGRKQNNATNAPAAPAQTNAAPAEAPAPAAAPEQTNA